MTVKILIKRKFKNADSKNVSQVITMSRKNAMMQKGYISSETMSSSADPNLILIISTWENMEDWENYKNSHARKTSEEKHAELFEKPTEYEMYNLGLPFALSEHEFVKPMEF